MVSPSQAAENFHLIRFFSRGGDVTGLACVDQFGLNRLDTELIRGGQPSTITPPPWDSPKVLIRKRSPKLLPMAIDRCGEATKPSAQINSGWGNFERSVAACCRAISKSRKSKRACNIHRSNHRLLAACQALAEPPGRGWMRSSITLQPCAIRLALKSSSVAFNVRPGFITPDHPMPATDGIGGRKKESPSRQTLGPILSLNLLQAAIRSRVPAPSG